MVDAELAHFFDTAAPLETLRYRDAALQRRYAIDYLDFILILFVLHFIKVFITVRFMDKNWERDQIDRLVALQQKKITQLERQIEKEIK